MERFIGGIELIDGRVKGLDVGEETLEPRFDSPDLGHELFATVA
jgi:hypothetical protein